MSRPELGIACRRCTNSRDRFTSVGQAARSGWRKIKPFNWQTEPACSYSGICPCSMCRTHPEDERKHL